jgi:hypothetical protein
LLKDFLAGGTALACAGGACNGFLALGAVTGSAGGLLKGFSGGGAIFAFAGGACTVSSPLDAVTVLPVDYEETFFWEVVK